jgi:hypothetical protein
VKDPVKFCCGILIGDCKKGVQYGKYCRRDKTPREVNEKPEDDYRQRKKKNFARAKWIMNVEHV